MSATAQCSRAGVWASAAAILALAGAGPPLPSAQSAHDLHALPVVDASLLIRPIALQPGIGRAPDPVATKSGEAQQLFSQGLTYLHHFEWIQAARSFNQALRVDPHLALAWAGLSSAHTGLGQSAAARDAFDRAAATSDTATEHDRRHIEVRRRQMTAAAAPGNAAAMTAYRQGLDEAIAMFPADAELLLQRGIAESADPADRGQGSTTGSIAYYTQVLALAPDHFAAHHYLTHAYENSGRIDEALAHGERYAQGAPNIPHARHMFGHDLRRVGRIDEALAQFEAADRLAAGLFAREPVRPEHDWHYEHNLDLLGTSYQHAGRMVRAEEVLRRAYGLPTSNLVQAVNKRQWLMFLRARGRADEAMADAGALLAYPHPVAVAIGHIERGHAWLAKDRFAEAAGAANAALAAMKTAPTGAGLAAVPFEGLQGEYFLRTGQLSKGRPMLLAMLKKARAAVGPDEWVQALFTLESVASTARQSGDWELAAEVARQMLEHDPAYAGSHYASALVAEQRGQSRTAAAAFALAAKYWAGADSNLAELLESRAKARAW